MSGRLSVFGVMVVGLSMVTVMMMMYKVSTNSCEGGGDCFIDLTDEVANIITRICDDINNDPANGLVESGATLSITKLCS